MGGAVPSNDFALARRTHRRNARAADARVRKAAEVTGVVVGCAEDMKALWEDSGVQEMLRRKKIRMEEEPGLYVTILSLLPPLPPLFTAEGFQIY
jgi:hypothetical protein